MPETRLTEVFVRERQFFKSVTPATLKWYRYSFHVFSGCHLEDPAAVSTAELSTAIKERIVKITPNQAAVSINSCLRVVKAFLRWCLEEGHLKEIPKLPKLKEEEVAIVPMSPEQVQKLLNFRPRGKNQIRAHAISVAILDCGARIEEMLQIRREDVDLENQLLKIHGKGQKQRLIPISHQGRRILYKIMQSHDHDLLFCVAGGGRMSKRNSSRDLVALMKKVGITGIRKSWHTLRHSFAIAYIRSGGDVFRLQRILGHASLETTRRYVNLQTADLQSVHERFSLLASASR